MTTTHTFARAGVTTATLAALLFSTGCALFEGTLYPADGVRSSQRYYAPPAEAWVVQPSKTVADTFDDDKLVSRVTTEYAMPSAMRDNTFRGDTAFVEQDRSYRFDRTADGDGVEFNATQVINNDAYADGTAAQVARTEQTTQLVAAAVNTLGQVAGVYVQFLNQQGEREKAVSLRQLEMEEAKLEAEMAAMHSPAEPAAEAPAEAPAEGGE